MQILLFWKEVAALSLPAKEWEGGNGEGGGERSRHPPKIGLFRPTALKPQESLKPHAGESANIQPCPLDHH